MGSGGFRRCDVLIRLVSYGLWALLIASGTSCAAHELRTEKNGRIVDADTGMGIADAKVIARWGQHSSGVPEMVSAESWCNLQKIVTTDADGRFIIPDVSHELDAAEMHFGPLSWNKLRSEWFLVVFKPGYVRMGVDAESKGRTVYDAKESADDRKVLHHLITGDNAGCYPAPSQGCLDRFAWQGPAVEAITGAHGNVVIKTITMKKVELSPFELWTYYGTVLSTASCRDPHKGDLGQPELADVARIMAREVRPMPCTMPSTTPIDQKSFGVFVGVSHPGTFDIKFFKKVREMSGGPAVSERFDPLEQVHTNAGTVCRALAEEEQK